MLESFVYQYAVEAAVFGLGIYCGVKTGVLAPSNRLGRRRLLLLSAGFLLIFCIQGAFLVWGK